MIPSDFINMAKTIAETGAVQTTGIVPTGIVPPA
jgi:hypothetical protein